LHSELFGTLSNFGKTIDDLEGLAKTTNDGTLKKNQLDALQGWFSSKRNLTLLAVTFSKKRINNPLLTSREQSKWQASCKSGDNYIPMA